MIASRRARWLYLGGALVVLAAVSGLSGLALWYEARATEAQEREAHRARLRLALWRLDAYVQPVAGRLSGLAYAHFVPAYAPPAIFGPGGKPLTEPRLLEPSPILLSAWPAWVRLHFLASMEGPIRSPEVPGPSTEWVARLPGVSLPKEAKAELARLAAWLTPTVRTRLARELPMDARTARAEALAPLARPGSGSAAPLLAERDRRLRNLVNNDFNFAPPLGPDSADNVATNLGLPLPETNALANPDGTQAEPAAQVPVRLSPVRATFVTGEAGEAGEAGGPALILYRVAEARGHRFLQGALLDWPSLRAELAAEVADLFPGARLVPRPQTAAAVEGQMTALPVVLRASPRATARRLFSGTHLALYLAWLLVLLALGAGWVLTGRLVELGERRMDFVNAASHELRAPLTAFRMYLDLLADGMVPEPARQKEVLEKLRGQALRLSDLVGRVLDYARLERRTVKAKSEPLPAEALAAEITRASRTLCEAGGAPFEASQDDLQGRWVLTDPELALQVVALLVDNACKYGARAESPQVTLALRWEASGLAIVISDRGPGVPPESRQKIFEAFWRAGREMTREEPGVGLGLYLAKRFTRDLGGDLRLTGAPLPSGRIAAELTLSLPAAPPPDEPEPGRRS